MALAFLKSPVSTAFFRSFSRFFSAATRGAMMVLASPFCLATSLSSTPTGSTAQVFWWATMSGAAASSSPTRLRKSLAFLPSGPATPGLAVSASLSILPRAAFSSASSLPSAVLSGAIFSAAMSVLLSSSAVSISLSCVLIGTTGAVGGVVVGGGVPVVVVGAVSTPVAPFTPGGGFGAWPVGRGGGGRPPLAIGLSPSNSSNGGMCRSSLWPLAGSR